MSDPSPDTPDVNTPGHRSTEREQAAEQVTGFFEPPTDAPPEPGAAEPPAADGPTEFVEPVAEPAAPAGAGGPPRLQPRPLDRPGIDPAAAHVFGRPDGVEGAFARSGDQGARRNGGTATAPPPTAALAGAFGRPTGKIDPLQRPPGGGAYRAGALDDDSAPLWSGDESDPWRDPSTGATAGPPAVDEPETPERPRPEGVRLSLREVLFGGRVQPRALALLAVLALAVGAVGGLVGRVTAEGANSLTDGSVTLASTEPARERPPGSVADIAARVLPAVVSIEIRVGDEGGTGSGVLIEEAPDGGAYVLTNNHVIAPAAEVPEAQIEAIFNDGSRAPAQIVGRDPKTDLAVIRVGVTNPTLAAIGESSSLAVGDGVIAIGSPLGLTGTVTEGIVSAVQRPVPLDTSGADVYAVIDALQTDAAINPGNSGGPLVDATGAVVGINTAISSLGGGAGAEGGSIGLGFAIPIDDATVIAQELIRTGVVRHPVLGVNARSVVNIAAVGAEVQNVQTGSPAETGGIAVGDVITRLGERPVDSAEGLEVAVREYEPGTTVPVELIREGRPLTVSVVLGSD